MRARDDHLAAGIAVHARDDASSVCAILQLIRDRRADRFIAQSPCWAANTLIEAKQKAMLQASMTEYRVPVGKENVFKVPPSICDKDMKKIYTLMQQFYFW